MKKVGTIIFVISAVITSITYGTLNIGNKVLNTKTTEVAITSNEGKGADYNIKGDKKIVTYAEINDIDKVNSEIAHKYLDADLKKYNIPTEALDYVLKEDDYQGMYYDYRSKAIGYLASKNDKPTLDNDRILAMTEKGLVKYNEEHEEKLDIDKIKNNVGDVLTTIDTKIETLKSNKSLTTIVETVTNDTLRVGSLIAAIASAILLLVINGLVNGFKSSGTSFIISGGVLSLASLISKIKTPGFIQNLVGPALNYIQSKAFTMGLLYLAIGVLLFLLGVAFTKTKSPKQEIKED